MEHNDMETANLQRNRRSFLKTSILGGAAVLTGPWLMPRAIASESTSGTTQTGSQVALTAGKGRAELAFDGLQRFRSSIAAAIGNKQVVIKPNNVAIDNRLAASHPENLEGILEFLQSIGKTNVAIAE